MKPDGICRSGRMRGGRLRGESRPRASPGGTEGDVTGIAKLGSGCRPATEATAEQQTCNNLDRHSGCVG